MSPPDVHERSGELFEAISDGDVAAMKELLAAGVPPHVVKKIMEYWDLFGKYWDSANNYQGIVGFLELCSMECNS